MRVLEQAFPEVQMVALPGVVRDIAFTLADKLGAWSDERFGSNSVGRPMIPLPLAKPHLELERETVLLFGYGEALSRLKGFNARVVIPGHCSERILGLLEEAARNKSLSYTSCLDWTRKYIDFYEEVYENAKSAQELVTRLRERYPTIKGKDFAVECDGDPPRERKDVRGDD